MFFVIIKAGSGLSLAAIFLGLFRRHSISDNFAFVEMPGFF